MAISWKRDGSGAVYSSNLMVATNYGVSIPKYKIIGIDTSKGRRYRVIVEDSIIWVPNFGTDGFDEINSAFKTQALAKKAVEIHEASRPRMRRV